MVSRTEESLWRATLDELRGLRGDLQELTAVVRHAMARTDEGADLDRRGSATSPLLVVEEVAELLRTTRKVVYSMIERGQIPGVVRLGRKILVRRDRLMRFLSKTEATP
jgi:excisionase family DNA binding protein